MVEPPLRKKILRFSRIRIDRQEQATRCSTRAVHEACVADFAQFRWSAEGRALFQSRKMIVAVEERWLRWHFRRLSLTAMRCCRTRCLSLLVMLGDTLVARKSCASVLVASHTSIAKDHEDTGRLGSQSVVLSSATSLCRAHRWLWWSPASFSREQSKSTCCLSGQGLVLGVFTVVGIDAPAQPSMV